jgi:hypothetical protein
VLLVDQARRLLLPDCGIAAIVCGDDLKPCVFQIRQSRTSGERGNSDVWVSAVDNVSTELDRSSCLLPRARGIADADDRSMSSLMVKALREYVERELKRQKK